MTVASNEFGGNVGGALFSGAAAGLTDDADFGLGFAALELFVFVAALSAFVFAFAFAFALRSAESEVFTAAGAFFADRLVEATGLIDRADFAAALDFFASVVLVAVVAAIATAADFGGVGFFAVVLVAGVALAEGFFAAGFAIRGLLATLDTPAGGDFVGVFAPFADAVTDNLAVFLTDLVFVVFVVNL